MPRPRLRDSELTPLFIGYIKTTFFNNLKAAYENMGLNLPEYDMTIEAFRSVLRGESCKDSSVIAIEQAAINWAVSRSDPKAKELMASASAGTITGRIK